MSNLKTAEEIWQEFSETLSHDIDLLSPFAGKEIMTENNFLKAMHAFHNQHKPSDEWVEQETGKYSDAYKNSTDYASIHYSFKNGLLKAIDKIFKP